MGSTRLLVEAGHLLDVGARDECLLSGAGDDDHRHGGVAEQRLRGAATVIGEVNKVHEGLQLSLVPILADAVFKVALESEHSVRANQSSLTALVDGGIESLRALLMVRAEANLVAGLMIEATGVTDINRLQPLKERFTAAQGHVLGFLGARQAVRKTDKLEQSLNTLLAFGGDADNLFDLRQEELTLVAASQAAVRKASALAARLGLATGDLVTTAQKNSDRDGSYAQTAIGGGRILLLLIAAVPLLEISSIGLQRLVLRMSAGRRMLKSTPLHEHYLAQGWSRTQVVQRLWLVNLLFALIGFTLAQV